MAQVQNAARRDMLSDAQLLLSVSPMFKPSVVRDRSWSVQSLDTLAAVATNADFSLAPSAGSGQGSMGTFAENTARVSKKIMQTSAVTGRSLLNGNRKPGAQKARVLVVPSKKIKTRSTSGGNLMRASKISEGLPMTFPSTLPQKFRTIYYRDGRIGIYSKAERMALIHKFKRKRSRRVWTKKVRYSCRKNLAQQRIRIKGRFVKTTVPLKATEDEGSASPCSEADEIEHVEELDDEQDAGPDVSKKNESLSE
mmetsp:Transcript_9429/g.16512  ORF Transcript_9429/g.16512 Transcript_9429/m.16512 type:complete len:253 (+) Transcript_9429:374-1132(+)|eukprot:CAMPEP_0184522440 /NCGR_PEP_ID=MMETSP0198_2-20121128/8282_1 /TAXON_ID=1112570 /ORGANISM="Thraustochytrium sp., Strain LLF1b" /LENGTH=252 /DNA_ID=CAMNT_0026913265 /DNA_START=393 /DNA_END=1151 /DNA_ORIENTATION=+